MCVICVFLQVSAQEHYELEQERLRLAIVMERSAALEDKKLSIAFVTFRDEKNAEE